jgi:pilus assembly protein CpaE
VDRQSVDGIPDFRVSAVTDSRPQLRNAVGSDTITVLLIDLDTPDALDAIVEVLEIKPEIAVVGITGSTNVEHVIAAQRAGCKQLTSKPLKRDDLTMAIRRSLRETTTPNRESRVISVIGAVGGAGATTVACYLGEALNENGGSTAIFDLDFDFGGVALAWDTRGKYTIADIVGAGAVDDIMLENAAIKLPSGVHVIPRPPTIEQGHEIDDAVMGQILQAGRKVYHNVVLDLPRKLDAVTGCAIRASDKLLIVLQLTVPAIENTKRLITVLDRHGVPLDSMEFVVNRYRKNVHNLSIAMVEEQFKRKVLGILPNNYQSVAAAFDIGRPISQNDPIRCAIGDVAQKLLNPGAPPVKTGWFANFYRGRRAGLKTAR